ncbi:MAG: group III truncated hemoglobin [Bacteroidia bacterium]|nr:group III truncated hemoglobin [Bacteroidia bacterium]
MSVKKEINSKEQIEILIRHFYSKLLKDEMISKHFVTLDLEHHIPKVVAFWAFVLLDEAGYNTNVFEKHLHLNLDMEQTKRWLKLFTESIDELFTGEKAELAKQRAESIAYIFGSKFEEIKKRNTD